MQGKLPSIIGGAALAVIGLLLALEWGQDAAVFIHGVLSVGLLIAGIGLICRAVGLNWQEISARLLNPSTVQAVPHGSAARTCPHCRHAVPIGLQFCQNCGGKLPQMAVCPHCHSTNPPDAAFCGSCGQTVAPQAT